MLQKFLLIVMVKILNPYTEHHPQYGSGYGKLLTDLQANDARSRKILLMKMHKKKIILLVIVVFSMVAWGAMKFYAHPKVPTAPEVWVTTSKVKPTTQPLNVHAIGSLVARSVEITPEVAGHVKNILFKDGSPVKAGDPLIQLDDAIYASKFASAKAKLIYSENDFARKTSLGKQGAIARQAIDQADADFKEKKAEADESNVMLNMMRLIAPFDGVLGKCKINPGDYVNVGQSLVTLTDTKHLRVEYNIPETYLPRLKLGQEVTITSAAYPNKIFIGKVAFISPTITLENRSVALYAEVLNNEGLLTAGMFVDVNQILGTKKDVLLIPARSLVPILDGVEVYKVVDGKALAVPVTTGKRISDMVEVKQGLSSGDDVITDGQLKVRNGMPIKIKI